MGQLRSSFSILTISNGAIHLQDNCLLKQSMTITNDAENVTEWVVENYGNKRIFYMDTEGVLTELIHDNGKFTGFDEPEEIPVI